LQLAPEKGAKVLFLSPVCAIFEQYQRFGHRGDDFRALSLVLL
jgi:UDP-N-acetylmuramoylalanine-D-glutamate ligase